MAYAMIDYFSRPTIQSCFMRFTAIYKKKQALCSCAIVMYYGLLRQPFFVVSCDLTCAYCYLLPVIHVRCFFFLCSVSICVCVVCLMELVAYALSLLRSTLTPLFVILFLEYSQLMRIVVLGTWLLAIVFIAFIHYFLSVRLSQRS